jgi:hypothetical protein
MSMSKLLGALLIVVATGSSVRAADADWPVFRHDLRMTGATSAKGAIVHPKVLWSEYLGVPVQRLVQTSDTQPGENVYDLDGDGTLERIRLDGQTLHVETLSGAELCTISVKGRPLNGRPLAAKLFKDRPGQQLLAFSHKMDTGEGEGYCFTFDRGVRHGELAWTTGPLANHYSPTRIVDDVDGDGRPDIVVAPHYCVQIFDGLTGKLKAEIPWDVGRNYGYLGTAPARDGKHKDIFIICDFVAHVDCIRFRDGKWVHAWGHKYFDPNAAMPRGREVTLRVGPHPIADLDGDGRVEMAYLLADSTIDESWHLHVRDGETGKLKSDEKVTRSCSIRDLNGDGRSEVIFTSASRNRPNEEYLGVVGMNSFGKGKVEYLHHFPNTRPVLTEIPLPPSEDSIADEGRVDLLLTDPLGNGMPAVLCQTGRRYGGLTDRLEAIQFKTGVQTSVVWEFERAGHRLNLIRAVREEKRGFIATIRDLDAKTLLTVDSRGKILDEKPLGRPGGISTTPIVVDLDGDGHNEVVVQNAAEEIQALYFTRGQDKPDVVWSMPGLAMNSNPGRGRNGDLCVQSADVDGDGRPELLFAQAASSDTWSLVCADGKQRIRWRHRFDQCPSGGLEAGVNFWTFGRFSGQKRGCDVYVDFHRHSRISNEGCVLSGKDGHVLWERRGLIATETAMPFGGGIPAVADVNGDGVDDLVSMFWTIFVSVSGKTGEPIFPPAYLLNKHHFNRWIGYSWPTLADLDGDGKLDVYLNSHQNASGAVAAVKVDGKPLWAEFHAFDQGAVGFGPVADFNGDGKLEIVIPTLDGTLLCLDAKTGKRRWISPIAAASDVIAADVDGDGQLDLVFSGRDGQMWAVRGKDGTKLWSIQAPGRPVAADVDGDGLIELLAVGPDGVLRIVGDDAARPAGSLLKKGRS